MIYDQKYFDQEKEVPEYIYRFLLDLANVQKGDIVLDVGCGMGYLVKRLVPKCKKVIGVDISEYAVRTCRKKYPSAKIIASSASNLELEKDSVDVIFAKEVIEHLESIECEKTLKILYDALKPGGRLILTTPNINTWVWVPSILTFRRPFTLYGDPTHINLFTLRRIGRLLNISGFSESSITYHSREFHRFYKACPKTYGILNKFFYPISRSIVIVSIKN